LTSWSDYYVQLRIHRDGYVLGSEYINDLVEGEHKKEEHKVGHKDEHEEVGEHAASGGHGRMVFFLNKPSV
jgi:hypothetical protein